MTTVYLAWSPTANDTLAKHVQDEPVDLLVSYVVLKDFQKHRSRFNIRRWVMDSGAFSVANSGKTIALTDYIAASKDVDAFEVFALDVIGDPRASQRNYCKTWSAGAPGIPTFHRGSDFRYLDQMMRCDKIAIGGLVRASGKKTVCRTGLRAGMAEASAWVRARITGGPLMGSIRFGRCFLVGIRSSRDGSLGWVHRVSDAAFMPRENRFVDRGDGTSTTGTIRGFAMAPRTGGVMTTIRLVVLGKGRQEENVLCGKRGSA